MHDASGGASETSCIDHRAGSAQGPDSLHESHMKQHRHQIRGPHSLRPLSFHLFTFFVLLLLAASVAGCGSRDGASSSSGREATLRQIAAGYAQSGDLQKAQAALDKLNLANPGQLLLALAETDVSAGRTAEDVQPIASLAEALGARSQKVIAYLAPPATAAPTTAAGVPAVEPVVLAATIAAPTQPPASPTSVPPAAASTATPEPATATPAPPTNTPEPQNPRVLASNDVNLRGGPGKAYGVVARLRSGQEAPIIGRNASGDWWQLQMPGVKQAWVAGTVVKVLGAIDTVDVAQNIPPVPTAAPKPTAAPQPTAAPAASSGPHFTLVQRRLWTVEETGGVLAGGVSVNCGGQHVLHVYVKDAAGNLLNGVTVHENGGVRQELVSGSKAPGMAEYVLYPPGKDVVIVRDVDGREATSDTGAAPSVVSAIPYDILRSGHYCSTDADCAHLVSENGCSGHYSWHITFQRNY
jgi:uncharacterized protein YraI